MSSELSSKDRGAASQRLSDAYATQEPVHAKRRQRELAATYRPNAHMEHLLTMIAKKPDLRDILGTSMRMQLAYYENAKAAHQEVTAKHQKVKANE
jgi:hypothetical protein